METFAPLTWPPSYTVKKNPRSRHVRLKTSVKAGLELIVPARFNLKEVPEILEANKSWIMKQLQKIEVKRVAKEKNPLPTSISFTAFEQEWMIDYIPSDSSTLRLFKRPPFGLAILGDIKNKKATRDLLITWIRHQARLLLPKRLEEISFLTGLEFHGVQIRAQKSRWGSCSVDKTINLNYKLLFLPRHLTDHILVHELCHTVHLNHSGQFWRLVASFDADWKANSHEVRGADKYIPAWLDE